MKKHCLQRQGKAEKYFCFFHYHSVSCYLEMVSVESEADTCEACCPLLVPSALDLTAASWSFPLSQISPAGEEERSCFIDWIDSFQQQCLIRISWANSIRNSFWIVTCKAMVVIRFSGTTGDPCSFLTVTNWLEFYTTESSGYSYPILWECSCLVRCLWSWGTVSWPIRADQLQIQIYSHILVRWGNILSVSSDKSQSQHLPETHMVTL